MFRIIHSACSWVNVFGAFRFLFLFVWRIIFDTFTIDMFVVFRSQKSILDRGNREYVGVNFESDSPIFLIVG